jgi:two-component system, NarL family, response regulator NreC
MRRPIVQASLQSMASTIDDLTPRERDVLRLLALGHTNREIAGLLHISIRTAEFHRASIQRKLGVVARSQLVRLAIAHGAASFDQAQPSLLDSDEAGRG